ncbi:MAG: cupin domain-containing protein [Gammaproteobacteria bacterium]|nr:cupin domain-containing protein [Gammaproteobacteria bacterium]
MKPGIFRYDKEKEYFFKEGCWINELCNRDDDPDLSVAKATVSPGNTTHWHRLHGTIERYVILEGEGVVEVGELSPQIVVTGDVVLIPSGCWQRIRNNGKRNLVFLALCTPRFNESVYEEEV